MTVDWCLDLVWGNWRDWLVRLKGESVFAYPGILVLICRSVLSGLSKRVCFGVRGRGRGSGGEDSPVDGLVGPWVRGLNKD